MPAVRHEQMRNRSLETREFNHKILGDTALHNGAAQRKNCTNMVHAPRGAPF
jgi:hypothetical protein